MKRLPHLIVGMLTLLALGAIVLGLAGAPRTPDLQVHNAVGNTFAASSFVARATTVNATPGQASQTQIARIIYTAPEKVTVVGVGGDVTKGSVERYHGAQAEVVLSGFVITDPFNGWIAHGSTYTLVEPASKIVTAASAPVKGVAKTVITLDGRYVATLHEHVSYVYQGQRHSFDGQLVFLSINGSPV
jgi:hypothetical protein